MATVFLARDLKHDRLVALKVLRPELAAALGPERFLREIKLTAGLNHPHILPLLDSGETAGFLSYTMPFVEGESLRDRLDREKQLPLDAALGITRDVCAALNYAHSRGVIHRDIKPENILLQGDQAVVADFGIARAISAAGGDRLTGTGLAIGTPAYMSPEQASGERDLDGRADIYALGCVLYEMLAGQPPYTGPTAQAILARHAVDPMPPLRSVRQVLPPGVEQALAKALAKVPADRFATASQFASALSAASRRDAGAGGAARQRRWPLRTAVAVAFVIIAAGTWLAFRTSRSPVVPEASVIAVLPFAPAAPDSGLTALGYSLAGTVSANLDGVGPIRTVDRLTILTQAQGHRGVLTRDQAAALGRRFGARSVVYGSLVRQGSSVRVDVDLYTTDSLTPLARVTVTAPADSINALTDSVTWKLLAEVWRVGQPPSPSLSAITTHSVPALRAFLEGERFLAQGELDPAAAAYRRAFETDTVFWLAYFRYAYVFNWTERSGADSMSDLAWQHRSALPERERLLLELARPDTMSRTLALSKAYVERYPDYWPGWFQYADYLVHDAGELGHSSHEGQAALERTVTLNPGLVWGWEHLFEMASRAGDTATMARALDEMKRLGGGEFRRMRAGFDYLPAYRLLLESWRRFPGTGSPLMDSVARSVAAFGERVGWPVIYLQAIFGLPQAQVELDRRILDRSANPALRTDLHHSMAWAWMARGAWDSVQVELERFVSGAPADWGAGPAFESYRNAVFGLWLGGMDAARALAWRKAVTQALDRSPGSLEGGDSATLIWLDGLAASAGGDRAGVSRARQQLDSMNRPSLRRSLAAFELESSGAHRPALDSMAALVRDVAEGFTCCAGQTDAIARLALSRWLVAAGDTLRAVDILDGIENAYGPQHIIFDGPMYLERARIQEALGRRDEARKDYQQFLRRCDLPVPSLRPPVEQAAAALRRLSEQADPPGSP